jgi:UDP-N-acetylmuramoylalanine--D-glutamate ligase
VPVRRAASMNEAVTIAEEIAKPGDIALLSPAAASFDMFVDYAARGRAFKDAVGRLAASRSGGRER